MHRLEIELPEGLSLDTLQAKLSDLGVKSKVSNVSDEIDARLELACSGIADRVMETLADLLPSLVTASVSPLLAPEALIAAVSPAVHAATAPPPSQPDVAPQIPAQLAQILASLATSTQQGTTGRMGPPNVCGWDIHGNEWRKEWGPAPIPNAAFLG